MSEFGLVAGLKGFRRPLDFDGRSTRTEVVALALAYCVIALILFWSGMVVFGPSGGSVWRLLPLMLLLYPWPAMLVRRAHDAGQPAWIGIAAIILSAVPLLIVWPGQDGANEFGPDPRLTPDSSLPGSTGSPSI